MQAIIDKFPEELALLKNPWASDVGRGGSQAASSHSQPSVVASGLIEYGSAGGTMNANRLTCAKMGFQVGSTVQRPKDPEAIFKIIDLDTEQVKLRELDAATG